MAAVADRVILMMAFDVLFAARVHLFFFFLICFPVFLFFSYSDFSSSSRTTKHARVDLEGRKQAARRRSLFIHHHIDTISALGIAVQLQQGVPTVCLLLSHTAPTVSSSSALTRCSRRLSAVGRCSSFPFFIARWSGTVAFSISTCLQNLRRRWLCQRQLARLRTQHQLQPLCSQPS